MPCPPRMQGCRASCLHRQLVEAYRIERHRQEGEREAATGGYATELSEYRQLVTFRQWIEQHGR